MSASEILPIAMPVSAPAAGTKPQPENNKPLLSLSASALLSAYRTAGQKERVAQIEKLKAQDAQPSKEQLLHWMEIHSHAHSNSVLRRLSADKVETILTKSLQADPFAPVAKPVELMNDVLQDTNSLQQKQIKHTTLVMMAKRHIKSVMKNPVAALKHHRRGFFEATEKSFNILLEHAGRKQDGTRNKNVANAHIEQYFNNALNVDEGSKDSKLFRLKQLIGLAGEAEKHDLKPKIAADIFMPVYINEITAKNGIGNVLARQHVRNAIDYAPTANGPSYYLKKFTQTLQQGLQKLDQKRFTDRNQTSYASDRDKALVDYAGNVFSALKTRANDNKAMPASRTLDLVERTLKLTSDALQVNVNKDPMDAMNSVRTIQHMQIAADAITTAPGTASERKQADISQRIQALQNNVRDTIGQRYDAKTTAEIYEQSAFDSFQKFPGFNPPAKPGFIGRVASKARDWMVRHSLL